MYASSEHNAIHISAEAHTHVVHTLVSRMLQAQAWTIYGVNNILHHTQIYTSTIPVCLIHTKHAY